MSRRLAVAGLALAATSIACQPVQSSQDAQALRQEIVGLRSECAALKADLGRAALYPRWRIEFRSGIQADTYLLDTATGRVWREYEDPKSKELWWKESLVEDRQVPDDGQGPN